MSNLTNVTNIVSLDPGKGVGGDPFLALSGLPGVFAYAEDSPEFDITGDIDIAVHVALDEWASGVNQDLLGKWGNTRAYLLLVTFNGGLNFLSSPDGAYSANHDYTSNGALGIPNGTPKWLRSTLDVDDGAGNRVCNMFEGDDGTAWTSLGVASGTRVGTTSIVNSPDRLTIGAHKDAGTSSPAAGKFYRVVLRQGIGGPIVLYVDFTDLSKYNSDRTQIEAVTGQIINIAA